MRLLDVVQEWAGVGEITKGNNSRGFIAFAHCICLTGHVSIRGHHLMQKLNKLTCMECASTQVEHDC